MLTDFKPVIRGCGERTTSVCKALLAEVFSEEDIVVINEKPFEQALRVGYQIGIDAGRKWTFFLDADVLVCPQRLHEVMEYCLGCGDDVLVVQPHIHDKLWNMPRRGTYFYNTAYLADALACIPEVGACDRPESTGVLVELANAKSLERRECDVVYAIHDYGQYYADLYRKGYVFAHKFSDYLFLLTPMWRELAKSDDDFKVILSAAFQAKAVSEFRGIDKDSVPAEAERVLATICGVAPKDADVDVAAARELVETTLNSWQPDYLSRCIEFYMERRRVPIIRHCWNTLKSAVSSGTLIKEAKAHFVARALSYLFKKI